MNIVLESNQVLVPSGFALAVYYYGPKLFDIDAKSHKCYFKFSVFKLGQLVSHTVRYLHLLIDHSPGPFNRNSEESLDSNKSLFFCHIYAAAVARAVDSFEEERFQTLLKMQTTLPVVYENAHLRELPSTYQPSLIFSPTAPYYPPAFPSHYPKSYPQLLPNPEGSHP